MAMYGKIGDTPTNNFATRPGIFPGKGPKPESDYLFGSNMGLPEMENNLSISKARIKSVLPYPFSFGNCAPGHLGHSLQFPMPPGLIIAAGAITGSVIVGDRKWGPGGIYPKLVGAMLGAGLTTTILAGQHAAVHAGREHHHDGLLHLLNFLPQGRGE